MNKRKAFGYAAVGVLGLMIGSAGNSDATSTPAAAPTVTRTVTVTAPPVTITESVSVPAPTVTATVTVTQAAAAPKAASTPKATSTPKPAYIVPQPAPKAPSEVYYANCTEARSAGAAPLYVGDPGYRSGLDRDKDGVACES